MSKITQIQPLALQLINGISVDVYTVALPSEIKKLLFSLEKKAHDINKKRYNADYQCLPTNSLKAALESYLGLCSISTVRETSNDEKWLTFFNPVNVDHVFQIIKFWVKEQYSIEEIESLVSKVIDKIDALYKPELVTETIRLTGNCFETDKRIFDVLPMILESALVGKTVTVNDQEAVLVHSSKGELVTEPMMFTGPNGVDKFSFVIGFNVETLPLSEMIMINVHVSTRRWISCNENADMPYIADGKKAYLRTQDKMLLRAMKASYSGKSKTFEWDHLDCICARIVHGFVDLPDFSEVIRHPGDHMKSLVGDIFIPFEYGMKVKNGRPLHSMDAGITHSDRSSIFSQLSFLLRDICSVVPMAQNTFGNCAKARKMFSKGLEFLPNGEETFNELKSKILGSEPLCFEIGYTFKTKFIVDKFEEMVHKLFPDAEVKGFPVSDLILPLRVPDENAVRNLQGVTDRVEEVKRNCKKTSVKTVALFVIHDATYYSMEKNNQHIKCEIDPKKAIRKGLLESGRLSQFITEENLVTENAELIMRTAFLDVLRQLGFVNPFKTFNKADEVLYAGFYVLKNCVDIVGKEIKSIPVVVTLDLENLTLRVESRLKIKARSGNPISISIDCSYSDFPFVLQGILEQYKGNYIDGDRSFMQNWFNSVNTTRRRIVMCLSDRNTRAYIPGIANNILAKTCGNDLCSLSLPNDSSVDLARVNCDLVRLRVNDEVPDYIPKVDSENCKFPDVSGVFKFETVYYSKVGKPNQKEGNSNLADSSRVGNKQAYLHRNIYELYPVFTSEDEIDNIKDVHSLRNCNIQFEDNNTILPTPLHMAMKLEEYFKG